MYMFFYKNEEYISIIINHHQLKYITKEQVKTNKIQTYKIYTHTPLIDKNRECSRKENIKTVQLLIL